MRPVSGRRIAATVLLSGILLSFLNAQEGNLVINPSFEKKVDFQNGDPSLGWTKGLRNDSPDYITFTKRGEADFYYRKYIGGLLPVDGLAYAGIFCYRIHPLRGIREVREVIQAPLKQVLEKDSLYNVSFYIALDPESNRAINNFNAYFSSEAVSVKSEKALYQLTPRVRFKRTWYDGTTWVKLEQTYKARGNESRIAIGNFSKDGGTGKKRVSFESTMQAKWNLHELEEVAYYYVDMVNVSKVRNKSVPEVSLAPPPDSSLKESPPDSLPDRTQIELSTLKKDSSIVLNNIYFEFDKSTLLPRSNRELDRLYSQLSKHPELFIIIEGHTDNFGTFEYNMELSLARARSVSEYLTGKGLEQKRITSVGHGYTRPLSDNRSEEGRKMNRRVAFRISKTN